MQTDAPPPSTSTAWVFPGQGAHCAQMLEPFRGAPSFSEHYERVCALTHDAPRRIAAGEEHLINHNAVSSLLTVLASVCALDMLRASDPTAEPTAIAGYSVGQWTALYAAGAIDAETLFRVVAERARLMDLCVAAAPPSGMLAVIGLKLQDVEKLCAEIQSRGGALYVANYNAPGQLTLSGSEESLAQAHDALASLRPKKVARLPVAGAWHSPLLEEAAAQLGAFLAGVALRPTRVPVLDNVSGGFLPEREDERRAALARQVARPVRWHEGVKALAAAGVRHNLEVGYGDVLTKFGFFIDRSMRHSAMAPSPRERA